MNAATARHDDDAATVPFGRLMQQCEDLGGGWPRRFVAAANRWHDPVYTWPEIRARLEAVARRGRADRVFLYRHGATNYNRRNLVSGQHDTTLSEEGRGQACDLRASLPGQIDLFVCSALYRAFETMVISTPQEVRAKVPVLIDARLNEVHLGVLQGRRRRYLPEFDSGDLDFAPPEGETYRQAARRVLSATVDLLDRLAKRGSSPRQAVVFCHAGVLRIMATLTSDGKDPREVFAKSLGNAECLRLETPRVRLPDYWVGDDHDGARRSGSHRGLRG